MKYVLALSFPIALLAMAAQDPAPVPVAPVPAVAAPAAPEPSPFLGIDDAQWKTLGNYALIAAITAAAVEFLKKVIKRGPIDGHERFFAIVIAPVVGAALKGTAMAHAADPWGAHLIASVITGAVVAGLVHDGALGPIVKFVTGVLAKGDTAPAPGVPPE